MNMTISLPIQLPNLDFCCTTAQWEGELSPCSNLWGGYSLEEPVLASTPLKDVNWATLFAYMHRRFGPPHVGGDDYKDLSAGWMLTSPDSGVFVGVSPSLSGPGFSLKPYILADSGRGQWRPELVLPEARIGEIKQAYRHALLDLLRPVCVRDQVINALGELGETELDVALLAFDEDSDEGNRAFEVEQHSSSGYSMPTGLFGGDDWGTLCSIIVRAGQGNIQAGRSAVIALLQQETFREASIQSKWVKWLMLMAHHKNRALLQQGLQMSDSDMQEFDAEMKLLYGGSGGTWMPLSEMTPEVVAVADDFLDRLGLEDGDIKKRIRSFHLDKATDEAFKELQAIPGDEFPTGALPENPFDSSINLAEHMKSFFNGIGHQDLCNWVDATVARHYGAGALAQIAWHIKNSAKEDAEREEANAVDPAISEAKL